MFRGPADDFDDRDHADLSEAPLLRDTRRRDSLTEELEELELSQGTSNVAKGTLLDGIANVSGRVLLVDL